MIPASERAKTVNALDRAATVTDIYDLFLQLLTELQLISKGQIKAETASIF
jgi:hypothetical protein